MKATFIGYSASKLKFTCTFKKADFDINSHLNCDSLSFSQQKKIVWDTKTTILRNKIFSMHLLDDCDLVY